MEETLDFTEQTNKRPTFLTVLCILTFVSSGWGIVSSLVSQDAGLSAYYPMYYWILILLNVASLIGAILMWKLQKNGLYLYTLVSLISLVMMWVVVKGYIKTIIDGTNQLTPGNDELSTALQGASSTFIEGTMTFGLILVSIFTIIFTVMYWINAKYLK